MSKTIYLNMKTPQGIETIDEFTRGGRLPNDPREFRQYVRKMVAEYHSSGMPVYISGRSTKDWKNE